MAIARPQIQQRLPFVDAQGRLSNEGLRALNDAFQSIFTTLDQIVELYGITDALNSDLTALAGSGVILAAPGGFAAGRVFTSTPTIAITDAGAGSTITANFAGDSDDVPEGLANLYFTDARTRSALSNGTGMAYDSATGVIAVGTKLAAYAGGDTPSAFTLSIVDSADAAAWRAAIGAGTSSTTGTVTSVDVSGGATGLTFSGGPVTTSGTITLAGTLAVANGGTGATTAAAALTNLGAVASTRSISTGTGLVGGGNLTADRTLSLATSGVTAGSYGSATKIPTITIDVYGRATIASENTIPILASGTYTPTLTSVANVSASATYPARYLRVGNMVKVWGKIELAAVSAATLTRIAMSLPIVSNFANDWDADGTAAEATTGISYPGAILADAANDRVELNMYSANTSGHSVYYNFGYEIL